MKEKIEWDKLPKAKEEKKVLPSNQICLFNDDEDQYNAYWSKYGYEVY